MITFRNFSNAHFSHLSLNKIISSWSIHMKCISTTKKWSSYSWQHGIVLNTFFSLNSEGRFVFLRCQNNNVIYPILIAQIAFNEFIGSFSSITGPFLNGTYRIKRKYIKFIHFDEMLKKKTYIVNKIQRCLNIFLIECS